MAGATASTVAALALNGGFFSAPAAAGPAFAAAAFAAAAAGSLAASAVALQNFKACGGVPAACEGKFWSLQAHLAGAITTQLALGTAALVAAGVSWIPWIGVPPLAAMLAACLVQVALIGSFVAFLDRFNECLAAIASKRGPLREGEKESDPWFLRIRPLANEYRRAVSPQMIPGSEMVRSGATVLRCAQFTTQAWKVEAEAVAIEARTAVNFTWTVDGNPVIGTVIGATPPTSQLAHEIPASQGIHTVTVTARDSSGFTRSESFTVQDLAPQFQLCTLDLPYAPHHQSKVLEAIEHVLQTEHRPINGPIRRPETLSGRAADFIVRRAADLTRLVLPSRLRALLDLGHHQEPAIDAHVKTGH